MTDVPSWFLDFWDEIAHYNETRWFDESQVKAVQVGGECCIQLSTYGVTGEQAREIARLCRKLGLDWELGASGFGGRILLRTPDEFPEGRK